MILVQGLNTHYTDSGSNVSPNCQSCNLESAIGTILPVMNLHDQQKAL